MHKMPSRLFIAAMIVATISTIGCFKKAGESTTNAPSSAQTTASPEATNRSAPSPVGTLAAVAAIAVADGENPGTKAEVQELKRSGGNSVMLKFAIVNDSDKAMDFGYNFGDKANEVRDFNTIGGVTLVDSAGKKKYFVVRDSEDNCVCSTKLKDLAPKSRANLWAKFPAPPEDVQRISVVIPHFTPLDDVPISR